MPMALARRRGRGDRGLRQFRTGVEWVLPSVVGPGSLAPIPIGGISTSSVAVTRLLVNRSGRQ